MLAYLARPAGATAAGAAPRPARAARAARRSDRGRPAGDPAVRAASRQPRRPAAGAGRARRRRRAAGPSRPSRPAAPTIGREAVAARLLEIVRDRTGYPAEMLGLDLDLEADLGIDSIKRVEILGTLRDAVPALERLGRLARRWTPSRGPGPSARSSTGSSEIARQAESTPRPRRSRPAGERRRRAGEPSASRSRARSGGWSSRRSTPRCPTTGAGLMPGGVVVVTDDGRGVARGVAAELRGGGPSGRARRARTRSTSTSPSAVEALLDRARASGPIWRGSSTPCRSARPPAAGPRPGGLGGPDRGRRSGGCSCWPRPRRPTWSGPPRRGGGGLIAATAMGGAFASARHRGVDFFPGHGGIAGLVKTLAREWPGVRARVVDLDPRERRRAPRRDGSSPRSSPTTAGRRSATTGAVGSGSGPWPAPLGSGGRRRIELSPGEPVLVTGGAPGDHGDGRRRAGPPLAADAPAARAGARCPPSAEDRETAGLASAGRAEGGAPRPAPPRRARRSARPTSSGPTRRSAGPARSGRTCDAFRDGRGDRRVRPGRRPRRRGARPGPRRLAAAVRRPGRPDPRRGGDPGQAAPRQDARVVRPRPRHQARRGPEPRPAAPTPSRSGSPRSSRRSPAGSATAASPTTRRPTRS